MVCDQPSLHVRVLSIKVKHLMFVEESRYLGHKFVDNILRT
jgi:hypothetical protein